MRTTGSVPAGGKRTRRPRAAAAPRSRRNPRRPPGPYVVRMADGGSAFDRYVAWYAWARTNLVRDAIVCHAAAAAAARVEAGGGDRDAAAGAALRAAADEETIRRTRAGYGYRQLYVEWFVWIKATQGLSHARCHEAAASMLRSIAPGEDGASCLRCAR